MGTGHSQQSLFTPKLFGKETPFHREMQNERQLIITLGINLLQGVFVLCHLVICLVVDVIRTDSVRSECACARVCRLQVELLWFRGIKSMAISAQGKKWTEKTVPAMI